jgi:type VI secretion system secreted protein Hcp
MPQEQMAIETFLKLGTIEGESVDEAKHFRDAMDGETSSGTHQKEIEVLDWQWGLVNNAPIEMTSAEATTKTTANDLVITKAIDHASGTLMQFCALGEHIPSGQLTCRKNAGDSKFEFLVIELTDVKIVSVVWDRSAENYRGETLTLRFSEFKVKYKQQVNTGAVTSKDPAKGVVEFQFNIPHHRMHHQHHR